MQERASEGTPCPRKLIWPNYFLEAEQLFMPFAITYYDSHHLDKTASSLCFLTTFSISAVLRPSAGYAKNHLVEFSEEFYPYYRSFWEDLLASRFVYLYQTPNYSTFGTRPPQSRFFITAIDFR